jgi:transcriptional regulator with XRE-family HTH domain
MGRNSRTRPKRLAEKLKEIREILGLSQDAMLIQLGLNNMEGLERSVISAFELDKREPSLDVLLAYARVANVYVEVLIDDKINLPDKLPSKIKSEGVKL